MKIQVIGQWSTSVEGIGNVVDGQVLDADPFVAEQFIQRGYARQYEIKPEPHEPKKSAGSAGNGAGSSQAAQAARQPAKSRKRETKA